MILPNNSQGQLGHNPMHWLFFSDNYPPETNAAASRVHERAIELVRLGHRVSVITSCPNFPYGVPFPGYKNRWYQRELLDGVAVIRVKTFMSKNEGALRRSLDFISYVIPAVISGLRMSRPDIVVGSCPHLLVPMTAICVARLRKLPVITEVADVWPDSAVSVGALSERSVITRLLRKIERWIYHNSNSIVAVTTGICEHIKQVSGDARPIKVIENGVDVGAVFPAKRDTTFFSVRHMDVPSFTLGYIGTLGLAQEMSVLLPQISKVMLLDECFLIAGPGADRVLVERALDDLRDPRILLHQAVAKNEVPRLWALCDVAIIRLRDSSALRSALPSKLIELSALGVPAIFIGPEGVASRFVVEHGIGLYVEPDNLVQLRKAIDVVRHDVNWLKRCRAAMVLVAKTYSRERQAQRLAELGKTTIDEIKLM